MARWERLCRVDACPPGRNQFVRIGTLELALFHVLETGEFVVTANSCPHAGGNLSAGEVVGSTVRCPWHQWEFNLSSGACVHNDQVRIRRYPVRIEDGWLVVDVDGGAADASPAPRPTLT